MQDIIEKIADIYFRYGIKSVTMDDLARQLGISKKTLYNHFSDKKDVVKKVIHHLIHVQKCGISEVVNKASTNAIDKLLMMTRFFAEHLKNSNAALSYDLQKYYPEIWDEVLEFKREEIYKHIIDNVETGIKEGLYRDDMNYEIIARAYVSRMEMYQTDLWQPLDKYSLTDVFRTLFIYHIRGISNAKGINYLEKNMDKW
ncbi:MAG: TetR/AcrR family transcriptional regulator [Bacteroidetes bacterium]|nr:MAG: TetR/AcrR family transcriptional regulator [Bacteroidota bacterium]